MQDFSQLTNFKISFIISSSGKLLRSFCSIFYWTGKNIDIINFMEKSRGLDYFGSMFYILLTLTSKGSIIVNNGQISFEEFLSTIIVLILHLKNYFDVYKMFISFEPRTSRTYGEQALKGIGGYIDLTNFAIPRTTKYYTTPPTMDDLKFDLEFGLGINVILYGATFMQLMGF